MTQFTLPNRLTNRDIDILTILWDSQGPMTASQIVATNPDLTMNTVQAVLRKLLKTNLIEVADIVYSGTVLSRSYAPTLSSDEFAMAQLMADYQKITKALSKAHLICFLLDSETDKQKAKETVEELEKLLEEYKKKL